MSTRARLLVASLSTGLVFYIALGSVLGRVMGDTTYGQLSVFNEVVRMVIDSYVEPIDLDRTMDGAYLGLTEALDGDSNYLDADQFLAMGRRADAADVGLILSRRHGFVMVVGTRPGSPAQRGGIRTGDLLKTIDGRHTRGVSPPAAERMLAGDPGGRVHLEIHRAGVELIEIDLVRERLADAAPSLERLPDGAARLAIRELSKGAADAARTELQALNREGVTRLVLDLRGSCYGPLEQSARLAELFLDGGVVARVRGRGADERVLEARADQRVWSAPLVVLTDRGTAGAAEVAAAALKEAGRAQIVGERSFGRAPVQRAFPLDEGGLLLTVATYHTAGGELIHGRGLQPDHPVAPAADDAPDAALAKALELLSGELSEAAEAA